MALGVLLALCLSAPAARGDGLGARVKDITSIKGIRSNQLYGFGLIFGLAGTGSGSDFTSEVTENMLEKLRVGRGLSEIDAANLAAVMVTAELPPFAHKGSTIDVTVSALDESQSLRGGTLVLTPLMGADGEV
ncbi:MAG: flagellar basal body P-ring protein FlgI, partial [Planctomycetota bacterium]